MTASDLVQKFLSFEYLTLGVVNGMIKCGNGGVDCGPFTHVDIECGSSQCSAGSGVKASRKNQFSPGNLAVQGFSRFALKTVLNSFSQNMEVAK